MGCGNSSCHGRNQVQNMSMYHPDTIQEKLRFICVGARHAGVSSLIGRFQTVSAYKLNTKEKKYFVPVIKKHIIHNMQVLCGCMERSTIPKFLLKSYDIVIAAMTTDELSLELGHAIKFLWSEDIIRKAWKTHDPNKLTNNSNYFFDHLERILSPGFIPVEDDILHCSLISHGCTIHSCISNERYYELYDGGNTFETCVWDGKRRSIQFNQLFNGIIYVVSLADYDQLHDDKITSLLTSSLRKFEDMCKVNLWTKLPVILIFNKRDILSEKILGSNIQDYPDFDDYGGKVHFAEPAANYLIEKFVSSINKFMCGKIFVHTGSVLDNKYSNLCQGILTDSNDIVKLQNRNTIHFNVI